MLYKLQNNNVVNCRYDIIFKDIVSKYTGWHWFATIEDAKAFFGII